jgi:CBS domain-containing protein
MIRRVIPDVIQNQDLLILETKDTVRTATRQMKKRGVRSVLVMEADELAGIFTGTDLIERVVAEGLDPETALLEAVMTPEPATISSDTLAIEALRTMHEAGYRHLPVVDEGRLVGVVSRRNFMPDEESEIELEEQLWERL